MATAVVLAGIAVLGGGIILLAEMALSRRGVDPSFVAALVATARDGDVAPADDEKLKSLSEWFALHRHGWQAVVAPSPRSEFSLTLTYADGSVVRVDVFTGARFPGWRGTLQLYANRADANAIRKFPEAEFDELLGLLAR